VAGTFVDRVTKPGKPVKKTWRLVVSVALIVLAALTATWLAISRHGPTQIAVRSAAATGDGTSGPSQTFGPAAPVASPEIPPTASPSSSSASTTAIGLCQHRLAQYAGALNPTHVSLVAVYDSTARDVANDDAHRHEAGYRSPFAQRTAAEHEGVCWFDSDGFWAPPVVMSDPAKAARVKTRIEEIVRPDGVPLVYAMGRKESISPTAIPASSTQAAGTTAPDTSGAGR
jgi:hypothetical protein